MSTSEPDFLKEFRSWGLNYNDFVALFSYTSMLLNSRTAGLAEHVVGKSTFCHILTLYSYLEENKKEDDEQLKDVSLRIRRVNLCDGKHPSLLSFSWTRAEIRRLTTAVQREH